MLILFTAKSKPHSLNNLSHNNSRLCHGRIKKSIKTTNFAEIQNY